MSSRTGRIAGRHLGWRRGDAFPCGTGIASSAGIPRTSRPPRQRPNPPLSCLRTTGSAIPATGSLTHRPTSRFLHETQHRCVQRLRPASWSRGLRLWASGSLIRRSPANRSTSVVRSISDSAMLSAAMRSGAVASRQRQAPPASGESSSPPCDRRGRRPAVESHGNQHSARKVPPSPAPGQGIGSLMRDACKPIRRRDHELAPGRLSRTRQRTGRRRRRRNSGNVAEARRPHRRSRSQPRAIHLRERSAGPPAHRLLTRRYGALSAGCGSGCVSLGGWCCRGWVAVALVALDGAARLGAPR